MSLSRTRRRVLVGVTAVVGATTVALLGLAQVVYRDMPAPRFEAMDPVAGVGRLSAAACGACHAEIYAEWKGSAHARAFTDPLYVAELRDQPAPWSCHRCHTPLVEQRETIVEGLWLALPGFFVTRSSTNERFDANLQNEGVTCVACHQVDGALAGPFESKAAPHPTMKTDLRAVENCQRCHELHLGFVGRNLQRPIMDTVSQWREYSAAGGDKRCADCHLPFHERPRPAAANGEPRPGTNHALRGPWEDAFVKTALTIEEVSLERLDAGFEATLVVFNATGHRLPTAEPNRFITFSARAIETDGSIRDETIVRIERPVDVFRLREKPGLETWFEPRERRTIKLSLEDPGDATVVVAVDFWRWNPQESAAEHAGLGEAELRTRLFEKTDAPG